VFYGLPFPYQIQKDKHHDQKEDRSIRQVLVEAKCQHGSCTAIEGGAIGQVLLAWLSRIYLNQSILR